MNVRYSGRIAAAALVCLAASAHRARANFTVDSWNLACVIVPPVDPPRGVIFNVVEDPFHATHQISWSGATDSANYDVSFDQQTFDFHVSASVTAPGITGSGIFQSTCQGGIHISNDATPLLVSVDSSFTWALPAGDRDAYLSVLVESGSTTYFLGTGGATPRTGDPPSGTVSPHADSIFLSPYGTYGVFYEMRVDSFFCSPSALGRGDGFAHFHSEVVPEPSALAYMLFALPWFHRRLLFSRFGSQPRGQPRPAA